MYITILPYYSIRILVSYWWCFKLCFWDLNKRENRAWLKVTDTVFFFWTMSIILIFKKKHSILGAGSVFCFHHQVKMHLTWWTPYIELFSVTGYHKTVNWLRYAKRKPWTQTDQTIDTTRNPEHIYLKFLTPLTPCVEKVVNFHGQVSL